MFLLVLQRNKCTLFLLCSTKAEIFTVNIPNVAPNWTQVKTRKRERKKNMQLHFGVGAMSLKIRIFLITYLKSLYLSNINIDINLDISVWRNFKWQSNPLTYTRVSPICPLGGAICQCCLFQIRGQDESFKTIKTYSPNVFQTFNTNLLWKGSWHRNTVGVCWQGLKQTESTGQKLWRVCLRRDTLHWKVNETIKKGHTKTTRRH